MNDSVIVSIVNTDGTYMEDFEIPANVKVGEWIGQVQKYLLAEKSEYFNYVRYSSKLVLMHNNAAIKDTDTIDSLRIMDGNILTAAWR